MQPESLIPAVEAQVRDLDPGLPLFDVMPLERTLAGVNGYFLFHVGVGFAGVLGGLGMLLAVVGLYGVVSFTATRRTHEIGIRMALGARPGSIFSLVLCQAVVLVGGRNWPRTHRRTGRHAPSLHHADGRRALRPCHVRKRRRGPGCSSSRRVFPAGAARRPARSFHRFTL